MKNSLLIITVLMSLKIAQISSVYMLGTEICHRQNNSPRFSWHFPNFPEVLSNFPEISQENTLSLIFPGKLSHLRTFPKPASSGNMWLVDVWLVNIHNNTARRPGFGHLLQVLEAQLLQGCRLNNQHGLRRWWLSVGVADLQESRSALR